jgi:hypothetical protein
MGTVDTAVAAATVDVCTSGGDDATWDGADADGGVLMVIISISGGDDDATGGLPST